MSSIKENYAKLQQISRQIATCDIETEDEPYGWQDGYNDWLHEEVRWGGPPQSLALTAQAMLVPTIINPDNRQTPYYNVNYLAFTNNYLRFNIWDHISYTAQSSGQILTISLAAKGNFQIQALFQIDLFEDTGVAIENTATYYTSCTVQGGKTTNVDVNISGLQDMERYQVNLIGVICS